MRKQAGRKRGVATRCFICLTLICIHVSAQERLRIDLRGWDYKSPESAVSRFRTQLSSQIISVAPNGEVVLGFVTRDRTGLATRELPPLSLHVVRFAKNGKFLAQSAVPTPSWYENAVFYGSNDTLLIRAGTKLYLFSQNMERLADKDLPLTSDSGMIDWKIRPLPSRNTFLLYNYRGTETSIALLRWSDLKPVKECAYDPNDQLLSVSQSNLLSFRPGGSKDPLGRTVIVTEICGSSRFSYSWEGNATSAALIDDDTFILAGGSSSVGIVAGNKVRWTDAFDRKSDVVNSHVEVTADSQIVAIAVKKFEGGSKFLDISPKLKSVKIVVYQAASGKKILECTVNPPPSDGFDYALSPDGDVLAIVSDGFLEIVQLK